MLVFDYDFLFLDEETLGNEKSESVRKSIAIKEQTTLNLSDIFSIRSPWVTMTLRNVRYYSNKRFEVMSPNENWGLEIENIVTLIWNGKDTITYIKGSEYSVELLQFWVFHTFFPLVLEVQRVHRILHVGGVELNGKAVLFSAFSFGGKSTLTEYFLEHNHPILGDDTIAILKEKDAYKAMASYPFYRPYREPETLGKPIQNFVKSPLALHCIYYLEKSDKNADIVISKLQGIEKFKAFHYSSFINFDFLKKEHMAFFADMSESIPIYVITVPWDLDRLDEVYQAILLHNGV